MKISQNLPKLTQKVKGKRVACISLHRLAFLASDSFEFYFMTQRGLLIRCGFRILTSCKNFKKKLCICRYITKK